MQKKFIATILTLIILSSALATIGPVLAQTSSNARPIKIGLVAPVSKSPVGQDMQRAADLAVEEINDAGGVYVAEWGTNVDIEIVLADTVDAAPANAVPPVTRAVTVDNVDLLIGGYGSSATLADEVVAIENRVPFIITGASNALVTRRGPQGNYGGLSETDPQAITDAEGMTYVFHYCTTTYDYSSTVVKFFAEVMKPMVAADRDFRLALLYRDDAFGNGVAQSTKYWIEELDLPITISSDLKYPTTTTDFQTQLTQIKGEQPDAIYVADNPDRTPTVIKQGVNEVGLKTVYIAVENNQDPVFYSLLGRSGENQLLESKLDPFMDPSYLPLIPQYVQRYKDAYGTIPGMMGADTYDAFFIAKAAIEAAGTLDKAAVRTAIEQSAIDDLLILTKTGKIQFSTGANWHEIEPVTYIEQLKYDETLGECRSVIVWPESVPNVGTIKQMDFVLPEGYPLASDGGSLGIDSTLLYVIVAVVVVVVVVVAFVLLKRRSK